MSEAKELDVWAKVELMGHGQTAGRISRPSDWGGLLRVDVPEGEAYRTEFYGLPAIYSIKLVSEEIARAFAAPLHEQLSYDAPIITREQHEAKMREAYLGARRMQTQIEELERRLIAVKALPLSSSNEGDWDGEDKEDPI